MQKDFSKIKTTEQLFFQKVRNTVEIYSDRFFIRVFPYSSYTGAYFITSIKTDNFAFTIYNTVRTLNDEIPSEDNYLGDWYVSVSKAGGKISIFDNNNYGIILKK